MTFFSESGYTINTQRADGYNINFLIINFSLEKDSLRMKTLFSR